LGIRPGTKQGVNLGAQVTHIEPLWGSQGGFFVRVGENDLRVVAEADAKDAIADKVSISFSSKDVFLFDARTGGVYPK